MQSQPGAKVEVIIFSTAIVDEDHSELSPPHPASHPSTFFQDTLLEIPATQIGPSMDASRFVFVGQIPPKFEQDVISNRYPSIQINMDATAVAQAGIGGAYLQQIINQVVVTHYNRAQGDRNDPERSGQLRAGQFRYPRQDVNPNLKSEWFTSVMQVIDNVTMLSVILTGAALIREREHGTIEHLLAMPVVPAEVVWLRSGPTGS